MTRLRAFWLHLFLLWHGVCPKHGKVIEFGDVGCELCQQQSFNRRARKAAESFVELSTMNGGRHA